MKRLTSNVSGDTLTISGLESEEIRSVRITVFVPKESLKGIAVNGAVATVRWLEPASLNIIQKSGTVWITDCNIEKMEIDLQQSYLNLNTTSLDTLSANIEGSHVSINSPVAVMTGTVKNEGFLRMSDVREIQLKKDESSNVTLHQ